jgi:hypothetical protein
MSSQKSLVNRVVAIDARYVRSYAPPYDLPDPMLYTCGSAIPAAVSVNKELFYGTVDGGIQALA